MLPNRCLHRALPWGYYSAAGPWGSGGGGTLLARCAGARPASPFLFPHLLWLPWCPAPSTVTLICSPKASGLCLFHITAQIPASLPCCQGSVPGATLSYPSFCLLLQPHFLPFSLGATLPQLYWPPTKLLHLRTFAPAGSWLGTLCSLGQLFFVTQV